MNRPTDTNTEQYRKPVIADRSCSPSIQTRRQALHGPFVIVDQLVLFHRLICCPFLTTTRGAMHIPKRSYGIYYIWFTDEQGRKRKISA